MDSLMAVNFLAVVVSGILCFAIGGLWYSGLLFGKQWQALSGVDWENAKNVGVSYFMTLLGFLLLAWGIGVVMSQGGVSGLDGGLKAGALVYVFIIAPLMLSQTLFGNQKMALFYIDGGYRLVTTLLIGVILGVWN